MPTFLIVTLSDGLRFRPAVAADLATLEASLQAALTSTLATGLPLYLGQKALNQVVGPAADTIATGAGDGEVLVGIIQLDAGAKLSPGVNPANPVSNWNDNQIWRPILKQADEARINTATLASDSELAFLMAANTKYAIRGAVFFDTTAASDFKYGFVGPAATGVRMGRSHAIAGAAPTPLALDTAIPTGIALAGTGTLGGIVSFDAIYWVGGTAGTFAFQFAQNTATGDTGAIVRAGSYLEWATL